MHLALAQASKGLFSTTPNPRVGCVFVLDNTVLASGHHQQTGQPHAEAHAIALAHIQGISLHGATAYVNLEPCSHQGRTGPCTTALLQAGVARVVIGTVDPNPLVAGQGIATLKAAGVEVSLGVLEAQARWLNRGFLSRMERKRPWVRLKVACSADGITALNNGQSQWITGEAARLDGHALRAQACAVLTGIGTVQADDPQLNVRGLTTPRQPLKVVIDNRFEIAPTAKILETGHTLIVHAQAGAPKWFAQHPNTANLAHMNVAQEEPSRPEQKTDLSLLMTALALRTPQPINELHIEAGHRLNGALLQAGLVDEIVQYVSPKFLGAGAGLFQLPPSTHIPDNSWQLQSMVQLGEDIKLVWIQKNSITQEQTCSPAL